MSTFFYGHGSWVFIIFFFALFAMRALPLAPAPAGVARGLSSAEFIHSDHGR